jgi:hypothetical protein
MRTLSNYIVLILAGFEFTHRRRAIWILPALVYCLLSQTPVSATTLSDLVATNGSIQQGDKLFNNFSFSTFVVAIGDVSPLDPGTIDVQGITLSGDNGLRFSGPFSATFPGDGGSLASVTYHLSYDVSVTDPTFKATDFTQSFTVTSGGVTSAHVSATVKNCTDLVCIPPPPSNFELFSADTGFTGAPPSSPATLSNTFDFPFGTSFLNVELDISLCALCSVFNPPDPAFVKFPFFDEIYSQAVPEPSALAILGTGLLALSLIQLRRRSS